MTNFSLKIFLAFIFLLAGSTGGAALELLASPEIDGLKHRISTLQDSIATLQLRIAGVETNFDALNNTIYQSQKELETNNNPLVRLRLDRALRAARDLGDTLENLNKTLHRQEAKLQLLYEDAINTINEEIEKLVRDTSANRSPEVKRIKFEKIAALEMDKSVYQEQVANKQPRQTGWRSLEVQNSDSPRRIRLKKAILEEQLQTTQQQIADYRQRQVFIEKDQKLYQEMLDFYTELNQGIDDEQEFFDRNRLDELNDRLDLLATEKKTLEDTIGLLEQDMALLREKLGSFPNTFEIKD